MVDTQVEDGGQQLKESQAQFKVLTIWDHQDPGRHLLCVKGPSITGTVFLVLQQGKYGFPQTFNSTRDYHCKNLWNLISKSEI